METKKIFEKNPDIKIMAEGKEHVWFNPWVEAEKTFQFDMANIEDAEARLERFAPYIEKAFPETKKTHGIIESQLVEIPEMKKSMAAAGAKLPEGKFWLKCDSHLPISGSIKARGGIYEVLKFAEKTAMDNGMLKEDDDYSILLDDEHKALFAKYRVSVGSTGNLGLSIGIISAKLGFDVTVHMSSDARQWKKDLLREKGVTVVEYEDDYQIAVKEGREKAEADPMCHFVDDERSEDLFLGYSVAAKRIAKQFEEQGIICDKDHQVCVYIPCGVGGAPGGAAFGLNRIFGENIHIYFAEPVNSPCLMLGLMADMPGKISVHDIGLDGKTEADGLAVPRASEMVSEIMKYILDGCFSVGDERLYPYLAELKDTEGIWIEPSACAAFAGPEDIVKSEENMESDKKIVSSATTHIFWATGGRMVPEEEKQEYYIRGKNAVGEKK